MRLYIIISFLVAIPALANAQEDIDHPYQKFKVEGRLVLDRDLNEWKEYLSDRQFNNEWCGSMLDGNFIKSNIGLDLYKVTEECVETPIVIRNIGERGDSMYVDIDSPDSPDSVRIGEATYDRFYDYHSAGDSIRLVSLKDLKEEFFPDVKGPCVYMINKFFIFDDVEMYRLDRDFVYNVEMFCSNEIAALSNLPPFAVIRVFTRTETNRWWQYTGR